MVPTVVAPAVSGGDRVEEVEFETVYARLWPEMVRIARLMCGSVSLGEEIAQDAFIGLYRAWATVENPAGYVRRSIANGVSTYYRRRKLEVVARAEREITDQIPDVDETWAVLKQCTPRQRAIVVLRYYEDLPVSDIAELMGCSVGTVKSTLSRTLQQLRKVLS